MDDAPKAPADFDDFVARWEASGAAERANYQLFLSELCDVLGMTRPEPTRPDDSENALARISHRGNGIGLPGVS